MLLHSFYEIVATESGSEDVQGATFRIHINADSPIYKAHFPGRPITPGACMLQIVEELAQVCFDDTTLHIHEVKNAKFLSLLEPQDHPFVDVLLKGNRALFSVELSADSICFAKMTLITSEAV